MDVNTFTAHSRLLNAEDGDIAYTEFGDGPAVVFIHGIATSGVLWRHVVGELADTSRCVAIDLPAHGGTAPREDPSVGAMAEVVAELLDGLGIGEADLVGNDTGGAIAQIFAVRHPERLRSLTLTNCDTEGNFPPPAFARMIEGARHGLAAPAVAAIAADPAAWRSSALAGGYRDPAAIPDDAWRAYYTSIGATIERARDFERVLAAIDPADMAGIGEALRAFGKPALLVWGTGEEMFPVKWAYQLKETIPGARDVIEIDGAKLFFPEESPGDLVPHLRRFWGR